ncbi:hypothetical protein [Paenibacillus xylanexedens]|uniref:hypothetical protein n=1 Tax=Paenibacillus xylanexedens TaxID=528191 RepID=UPI000F529C1A|nr:hypothetical protein [Paenibacillus xylanexedens]RPK31764.1 hypothetical protein EDO6_02391 [Paenibacillus xylanexedens]
MDTKYAVVEWQDETINGDVIGKELSWELAEGLVRIAPEYYHREIITMDELKRIQKEVII